MKYLGVGKDLPAGEESDENGGWFSESHTAKGRLPCDPISPDRRVGRFDRERLGDSSK